MKLVLSLIGVVLLIVAAVYFLVPAMELPSFLPGYEAGLERTRTKHAIITAVIGAIVLGYAMARRRGQV